MIHFNLITLFPEMFKAMDFSIPGRAMARGLVKIDYYNPRDYAINAYGTVDDKPYGGGPGMVMMAEPLSKAIRQAKHHSGENTKVIYLSAQGKSLQQTDLINLSGLQQVILICGRYEGIDERIVQTEVDEEWSIGDYVLSGGELAAMVMMDGIIRLLPGVLGNECSKVEDSFYQGLLDYPHYTRPENFNLSDVPPVLLSGDHEKIRRWRMQQALGRTWLRRPDLLHKLTLTNEQSELLQLFINELGESNE